MKIEHTLCPSCSVGCGMSVILVDGLVVGTYPYKRHPVNEGKNCVNGRNAVRSENILASSFVGGGEVEFDVAVDEAVKVLSSVDNGEVAVICSGSNSNEEVGVIKNFADDMGYDVGFYADNFTNYDGEIASYDDVGDASVVFVIGDIFENPLIARRVICAAKKDAKIYCVDTLDESITKNISDEYFQTDSISEFLSNPDSSIMGALDESSVIVFNKLESSGDFDKVKALADNSGSKILPVFSKSNTKGVLSILEAYSQEEMVDLINNSKVLLTFNADLVGDFGCDPKELPTVISVSQFKNDSIGVSDVVIPVKSWLETEGTYTNSMGDTQCFNAVVEGSGDILSEIELIEKLQDKL